MLVTGGSGLVGSNLRELVDQDGSILEKYSFVFLSRKDADLTDASATRRLFVKHQPKYVINLAAKVGGLYANLECKDGSFYEDNLNINRNVLVMSYIFGVRKCISCLSTCIFPDDEAIIPLDESKIHLGPPHKSNADYANAKRQVDNLNRILNNLTHNNSLFTSVIPTNIYGQYDQFDLNYAHVIPALIHQAYLSCTRLKLAHSASLPVRGSGLPLRQFIYAKDLAKILLWMIEEYDDTEPMIACNCDEISIRTLAEMICTEFSRKFIKLEPVFENDTTEHHADGQYRKTASNAKFMSLQPSFQFTSLRDGLKATIEWFCDTYPEVRKSSCTHPSN